MKKALLFLPFLLLTSCGGGSQSSALPVLQSEKICLGTDPMCHPCTDLINFSRFDESMFVEMSHADFLANFTYPRPCPYMKVVWHVRAFENDREYDFTGTSTVTDGAIGNGDNDWKFWKDKYNFNLEYSAIELKQDYKCYVNEEKQLYLFYGQEVVFDKQSRILSDKVYQMNKEGYVTALYNFYITDQGVYQTQCMELYWFVETPPSDTSITSSSELSSNS